MIEARNVGGTPVLTGKDRLGHAFMVAAKDVQGIREEPGGTAVTLHHGPALHLRDPYQAVQAAYEEAKSPAPREEETA